ncbi:F420H(2):quinone oxidoreductase [Spirochaetia bacterium]|nr:F420H(2):quinone oxidoreductase [Spirochaetia bacterium]
MSGDGFWQPKIDLTRCTNCGQCENVCSYTHPDIIQPKDKIESQAYSIVTKDRKLLSEVSSGGAGYELGKLFLKNNYKVFGVEYDNNKNIASHIVIKSENELKKIIGSKYLQSYTVDAFKQVDIKEKYIFFGCPCQIDSLRRFTRNKNIERNWFFVDFFCHGVPSYHLWEKYSRHYVKKNTRIMGVKFRDKCNGWHKSMTMTMTMTNSIIYSRTLRKNDYFLNMFFGNYVLNESCYNCKFHGLNSAADIRIGDFWGRKYKNNKTGVSGAIVLTQAGCDTIKKLYQSCIIHEEDINTLLEGQIVNEIKPPKNRRFILEKLKTNMFLPLLYFIFAYKRWLKNSIPIGIKKIIRKYF